MHKRSIYSVEKRLFVCLSVCLSVCLLLSGIVYCIETA